MSGTHFCADFMRKKEKHDTCCRPNLTCYSCSCVLVTNIMLLALRHGYILCKYNCKYLYNGHRHLMIFPRYWNKHLYNLYLNNIVIYVPILRTMFFVFILIFFFPPVSFATVGQTDLYRLRGGPVNHRDLEHFLGGHAKNTRARTRERNKKKTVENDAACEISVAKDVRAQGVRRRDGQQTGFYFCFARRLQAGDAYNIGAAE